MIDEKHGLLRRDALKLETSKDLKGSERTGVRHHTELRWGMTHMRSFKLFFWKLLHLVISRDRKGSDFLDSSLTVKLH